MSGPERQAFADRAHRLARRLAEYSQENIAAGWLDDLEFMVWQDLTDRRLVEDLLVSPDGCVLPCLYPEEKEEFRRLSQAIGGWVEYDEVTPRIGRRSCRCAIGQCALRPGLSEQGSRFRKSEPRRVRGPDVTGSTGGRTGLDRARSNLAAAWSGRLS